MKNNRAVGNQSPVEKQKVIALVVIAGLALAGFILFLFKATDHRAELMRALGSRDPARLEQLLKDHPGLVEAKLPNRSPSDTWEPLHMAAWDGNNEAIELLLKHKAKVNARDANELTPLHYTVSRGRYDSAQLLINKGADMNAKGRDGRTTIELAKNLRDKRMIELFRIRGARE